MKKLFVSSLLLAATSCSQTDSTELESSGLAQVTIEKIGYDYVRVELVAQLTSSEDSIRFVGESHLEATLEAGTYSLELRYLDEENSVLLDSTFCPESLRPNDNIFTLTPGDNVEVINVCNEEGATLANLTITPVVHDDAHGEGDDHDHDHDDDNGSGDDDHDHGDHDHDHGDHDHDHDHDHGDDHDHEDPVVPADGEVILPEGVSSIVEINSIDAAMYNLGSFLGYDPIKQAFGEEDSCYVYLVAKVIEDDKTTYYLRSSFSHGGATHPAIAVAWQPSDELPGEIRIPDENDGFLRLNYETADFNSISEFTVKWLHIDHFHSDQCKALAPVAE